MPLPPPPPAIVQVAHPSASRVLARAKAAQGGAGWDRIRTLHGLGAVDAANLAGTAEAVEDVLGGAFSFRYDLGVTRGAHGFDGQTGWAQDPSGMPRALEGAWARQEAATGAFMATRAWWYPGRWKARIQYRTLAREDRRAFHVLDISPHGGRPFQLWVDGATWLPDRTVETRAGQPHITTFGDYREVAGVKLPFLLQTSQGTRVRLREIRVNEPGATEACARPEEPPPDSGFEDGLDSVTVPIRLAGTKIILDVELDGQGPFPMGLDTGGWASLTPATARTLGLAPQGTQQSGGIGAGSTAAGLARVGRVRLGGAWLERQDFQVLPGLEGTAEAPRAGLLGFELFRRFVVRVDYARGLLTLIRPGTWRPPEGATTLPFVFNGSMPQVAGTLDGRPGLFDLDTGSDSILDVHTPFASPLAKGAPARVTTTGIGGPATGRVLLARELRLGSVVLEDPYVFLSTMTRGKFADPAASGNVGGGFLSRFTVTFDYARQQVHFQQGD